MAAYYNEYDPVAAAVLREVMRDGLIAPGEIDDRSIELVQTSDLKGFSQVHLFAGFGIWSAAARIAGWSDDRPLWTASCPCPPFSSAGKVKACPSCAGLKPIPHVCRTGFFLCSICGHEWLADSRHLWPEVWRLVRDARPPCIMGEQVASADGRTWLDLVRASLDVLVYDAWGIDTCAAGFGAPHIRQRLYWLAHAEDVDRRHGERGTQEGIGPGEQRGRGPASGGALDGLVDSKLARLEGLAGDGDDGDESGRVGTVEARSAPAPSAPSGLDHALGDGRGAGRDDHAQHERDELDAIGEGSRGLADSGRLGRKMEIFDERGGGQAGRERKTNLAGMRLPFGGLAEGDGGDAQGDRRPGPVNGLWRNTDWLRCTDGLWRPAESGTFPLAPARAFRNRVAGLRGAGNAINLAQAAEFIRAVMPELPS